MKKEYQKYWLCGIIGAVCFGIGDWLLGYVDPGIINESFSVIKAGHGAGYDLTKLTITLLFGAIGVPFLVLGCVKMADLVTEEKRRKTFRFWMTLLPVGWLIIHFTVSISIYVYSWCMHSGTAETAEKLATDIIQMMQPAQMVSWFFAGIPLVLLIVYVLRGKTVLFVDGAPVGFEVRHSRIAVFQCNRYLLHERWAHHLVCISDLLLREMNQGGRQ